MRRPSIPRGGLWANHDFVKLWTGQSISEFGSAVSGARDPVARGEGAEREPVRVLAPHRARLPAVHPLRAARRRLGRPAAPPPDPHRRRREPRRPARLDPARVAARDPHDLAALRDHVRRRDLHRLLRRRVPVVPPLARRARPADRRELEAPDDGVDGADRRPGPRRRADRRAHRAVRDPRRRRELRRLDALHDPDPPPRDAARADGGRPEAEDASGAEGGRPLRRASPLPEVDRGLHRQLELLQQHRVLDRRALHGARPPHVVARRGRS